MEVIKGAEGKPRGTWLQREVGGVGRQAGGAVRAQSTFWPGVQYKVLGQYHRATVRFGA